MFAYLFTKIIEVDILNFTEAIAKDLIKQYSETLKTAGKIDPKLYDLYNVKRGLRNPDGTGVQAGITRIGNVHGYLINEGEKMPVKGELTYRGIDVEDIVRGKGDNYGYEETTFLLLFGHLPNREELQQFTELLSTYRDLPEGFMENVIMRPPSKDIMNKLEQATLALYSYDENPEDMSLENVLLQCIKLIARFPLIVTHSYQFRRHHFENKSMYVHSPKPELSTAENVMRTIRSNKQFGEKESLLLDLALIVHAEHGAGNNSTFACRVLSSTGTDTYSAIAAAVGSLKGPKHGGASNSVSSMLTDLKTNVPNWTEDDAVYDYLIKILHKEANDRSGLIYGMGHAIYTLDDPRAMLLKASAAKLAAENGFEKEFALVDAIERLTPKAFLEIKGDSKPMCANVDLYAGFVYSMLGIPQELYTPTFAIARIAGWSAHRIEEVFNDSRIIRPAYKAIIDKKEYVPIDQR